MRIALLALLLASCAPDLGDLDESTKPNRDEFCTHKAHVESANGYFDQSIYDKCMFGDVRSGDAGAQD